MSEYFRSHDGVSHIFPESAFSISCNLGRDSRVRVGGVDSFAKFERVTQDSESQFFWTRLNSTMLKATTAHNIGFGPVLSSTSLASSQLASRVALCGLRVHRKGYCIGPDAGRGRDRFSGIST